MCLGPHAPSHTLRVPGLPAATMMHTEACALYMLHQPTVDHPPRSSTRLRVQRVPGALAPLASACRRRSSPCVRGGSGRAIISSISSSHAPP
eukprot:6409140-Pyramimonas_sp.AAC.1